MAISSIQSSTLSLLAAAGRGRSGLTSSAAGILDLALAAHAQRDTVRSAPARQGEALGELTGKLRTVVSSAAPISLGSSFGKEEVLEFVDAYNDLQGFMGDNKGYFRPNLTDDMVGFARGGSARLHDIGISVGTDGTLSVNEDKLDTALADDFAKVKSALGGYNGLATRSGMMAANLHSTRSDELIRQLDTRTGNAPALEAIRTEVLSGGLINLFL